MVQSFFAKVLLKAVIVLGIITTTFAAEPLPVELEGVGIEEHLGKVISLDLDFIDEKGNKVWLRDFFDGRHPVILSLVYYGCPNLCQFLLNGLTTSLKGLEWKIGNQFQVVHVSIDPTEKPDLAFKKKQAHFQAYGHPQTEKGWYFLTGSEQNIKKLAEEMGFRYRYDADQKQYAHAAAISILTPEGKLSRYLYGVEFLPRDLKLALLEASDGKIGNFVDQFLMFCYHYDPKGRKYALMAINLMKIAAAVTVILLVGVFLRLSRNKKKNVLKK